MRVSLTLAFALIATASACNGSLQPTGDDDGPGDIDAGNVPDPTGDAGSCPSVVANLDPVSPIVVLLLDQSGSMTAAYGGGLNRYQAMVEALVAPTTGVVATLGSFVQFGATLYTSNNGNAGGTCPILTAVPPAADNYAAIDSLLRSNGPAGDTPTGESINGAMLAMQALPPDPDGEDHPLIIVLATDGEPDTCAVPNPQNGQPESLAAAQAAWTAGIQMFVLSIGNEVGAPHLQDMANAGAGLGIGGATNAPYYQANNPTELVTAFQEIIGGVRSCTFTVDGDVDLSQAGSGSVILNGMTLVFEDPNGWRMVDSNTLELLGSACDTYLNNPSVNFSATFPCGVIIE